MEDSSYTILNYQGSSVPTQYQALIFSAWLRSLRKYNASYKKIPSNPYYLCYHKFIENLLQKPSSVVAIAVLSTDHDVVLGFSVSREDVLDYIFVQPDQRGNKLSTALMPSPFTAFTHTTGMWHPIWQSKYKECEFKPKA